MSATLLEWAIIAFIVMAIGYIVWRGGAANPQGTGALGRKVSHLDGTVMRLARETEEIDRRVVEIERTAAKASDIKRLERQLGEQQALLGQMREMMAGSVRAADLRGEQLDRLYNFIVERGMSK